MKFTKDYLVSVGAEVVGWFVGSAVAVFAMRDFDLSDPLIWKVAAIAGGVGVLKGLASRFTGDPNSGSLRK